jgi:hypothetical protein
MIVKLLKATLPMAAILVMAHFLCYTNAESVISSDSEIETEQAIIEAEREVEIPNVVLFPWFSLLVGVIAYYVLSRYLHALPYTAIMFMSGEHCRPRSV